MKLQFALDKSAIGLSLLCVAHCLVLPTVAVLLPAMLATPLGGEIFHKLLLVGVVPVSAIALFLGCQKHREWRAISWGVAGLAVLVLTGLVGHDLFGEIGEKAFTLIGSGLIIVSHYKNYRLCQSHNGCAC